MIVDVLFTLTWICMDDHFDHGGEFVEERMAHLLRDEVSFQDRLFAVHGHMHLAPQAMPDPADRRAMDIHDAVHVRGNVFELFVKLRIDRIHHAMPHIFCRLPDNAQDGNANAQSYDWVENGVSQPDSDGTRQDRQRCESVGARVVPVRDERGGADLLADSYAED